MIENPESLDPVYLDFVSESEKSKKDVEAKEKELEAVKQKYEQAKEDGYEKKLARADVFKNDNELSKMRQKQKFYELSAESRQIYVRKEYIEAFKHDKEWNPQKSADLYFKNKTSQAASRQWTRGATPEAPKKTEKKEEKKSEE